ncbi:unnamed protein product [Diabrotica balteata]|nr:unnamed protein product [Diabrotica balteata]
MERIMLGISLRDKIRNIKIRRRTKVRDIMTDITEMKWHWAGHVARYNDNRSTWRILEWRPRTNKKHGKTLKKIGRWHKNSSRQIVD